VAYWLFPHQYTEEQAIDWLYYQGVELGGFDGGPGMAFNDRVIFFRRLGVLIASQRWGLDI
jgi:hypothetical protein